MRHAKVSRSPFWRMRGLPFFLLPVLGPKPHQLLNMRQIPYSNRVMQSGTCVCQPGYADSSNQALKCDKCHSDCATCWGKNDFECITCAANRVFDEYSNCVCVNWMVSDANGNCICPRPLVVDAYGKCFNPLTSCGLNEEMKAGRLGKPIKVPSNPQSNSQGLSC